MSLQIHYVNRLAEVIEPAVDFLSRDADLFARQRIVVPTAGAKAWLYAELAKRLGTSGEQAGDGIIANIEISFPGSITALLQPSRGKAPDAWSLDRLTFAVLAVITSRTDLQLPFDSAAEPLLAARRLAALFDNYHVRRSGMILRWEQGDPVISPTAADVVRDGERETPGLDAADHWQFDLWRAVRQHIGTPSPPARMSLAHQASREPLLVAGLQSLSLYQWQCLEQLGGACDVRVLLVHPAPGLRARWEQSLPQPSHDRAPLRRSPDPEFLDGFDQLLPVWLAGAKELQHLLASQGVGIDEPPAAAPEAIPDTLLGRMQQTIATGGEAAARHHDPATDRSIAIHRCHSLSRQAEVLHDAILQAFQEIEGLEPHEVVIVSPCLQKAAPHLEAVFQRTVPGRGSDTFARTIRLPLIVADRGIREVSEAADLLVDLLALPGSRCSVDDVLGVAGHPLVRAHFDTDDDTESLWADLTARTQVRWGLNEGHRTRRGLELATFADLHTWQLGLEGMLLGATLPDALPRPELGGVVPLAGLDPADIPAIATLVRIIDVIRELEAITAASRSVADWCDAIEAALIGLCGDAGGQLTEPLAQLRKLREAAAGTAAESTPVPFDDVRQMLAAWFEETPGRQPLRTGAITATSMVPLRGVPFKVVCVIGYDDGAVGVSETEGEDLVGRQQLVGDVDPRTDERRALLDCLLAAQNRLVITCNGRSIKNNQPLPLVTPLAELVDFAVRHGVDRKKLDDASSIEIGHPRHHLSHKNFESGGVQKGVIWSHDANAAAVSQALGAIVGSNDHPGTMADAGAAAPATTPPPGDTSEHEPLVVELSLLERMVADPLKLYLEETLGIDTWRTEEQATPATFSLVLEKRQIRTLTLELLHALLADAGAATAWIDSVRQSGRLPFGPHGDRQLDEIVQLARGLRAGLATMNLSLAEIVTRPINGIDLGGCRLVGHLGDVQPTSRQLVIVTAREADRDSPGRPLHRAALQLLVAQAAGLDVTHAAIISRRDGWKPGKRKNPTKKEPTPGLMEAWQSRIVRLGDELASQQAAATRLHDIVSLAHEAMLAARPTFGKLATCAADSRVREFKTYVGEDFYPRTSESIMFGVSPMFDEVFGQHPERMAFLDAFRKLLQPAYVGIAVGYRLT